MTHQLAIDAMKLTGDPGKLAPLAMRLTRSQFVAGVSRYEELADK